MKGRARSPKARARFLRSLQFRISYNKVAGLLYGMTVILTPGVSALKSLPQQEWGHFSPLRGAAQNCCFRQSAQDTSFGQVCGASPGSGQASPHARKQVLWVQRKAAHLCEGNGQCRRERSGYVCVHVSGSLESARKSLSKHVDL